MSQASTRCRLIEDGGDISFVKANVKGEP